MRNDHPWPDIAVKDGIGVVPLAQTIMKLSYIHEKKKPQRISLDSALSKEST